MEKVKNPLSHLSYKYPTYRDDKIKSGKKWLDGKRIDDNAEGLWRVHDKLYDMTEFIDRHPGGAEWLQLTKGVDITEQFETHHITDKASKMLAKFYVRDASLPRNYNFTFKETGFYRTLKRRVAARINDLDYTPKKISNVTSDLVMALIFASAVLGVKADNIYLGLLSGTFLLFMLVISHNYFHQRDNWRMFCFNLTLLNYREWRISHAMSHHLYTNSYYDLEISMFEPFLQWIPRPKSTKQKVMSTIFSPLFWTILIFVTAISRTIGYFTKQQEFKLDHLIPLSLPLAMFYLGRPDILLVLKYWAVIVATCSFLVGLVGLNAGHHHGDVTHEGDELDKSMDFGIYQLNCVIDRRDVKQSQFWTLVTFGHHTLHHMFPTLDHGVLPQLHDTFIDTCKEFQLELREYSWWPLIVGQFEQLQRTEPRTLKEMKLKH
ncbi:CLUMA_CG006886, isoform A [Clunio marinus]|uniref:Cytochrome b5-related protein n=1 Tax=Clunio marinus TaxID=568069 RepID=A0A1J1I4N5_9DIPT|nr:CLUMA_CG006886, isoform A [Clunio marinus]